MSAAPPQTVGPGSLPAHRERQAYPLTMVLPAIAVGRPELAGIDRRLAGLRAGLAALPGDLDRMAAVPVAAFRRQVADVLDHRGEVRAALEELLASATHVENADVRDIAAPLQAELRHLDGAYGRQRAALETVEAELGKATAAKRLADASARAQHIAGRSAGAAAAVELWQPVDALADALRGLTIGLDEVRPRPGP